MKPEGGRAIRAFVALRLEPAVTAAIAAFEADLRRLTAQVAWTKPANLHLTLRFLGDQIPPALLAALTPGLAAIAARTPPFTIEVRGTGSFPPTRPRVLWVGVRGAPLMALAAEVEAAARAVGLPPADPFLPHLTIGRVRGPRLEAELEPALRAAAERPWGASAVARLILYQSRLGPGGATYHPLEEFVLAGKNSSSP